MEQSIQNILKIFQHLHLVQKDIIHPTVLDEALYILVELIRVAIYLIAKVIKSHFYDVLFVYTI